MDLATGSAGDEADFADDIAAGEFSDFAEEVGFLEEEFLTEGGIGSGDDEDAGVGDAEGAAAVGITGADDGLPVFHEDLVEVGLVDAVFLEDDIEEVIEGGGRALHGAGTVGGEPPEMGDLVLGLPAERIHGGN